MTQLFTSDGHLTDPALRALIDDAPLEELSRLEIAEHLSFCDRCVDRYTALLCDEALLDPPEPVTPGVLKRLRERTAHLFFNRYCTVAAAAVFAIVFWNIGVFDIDLDRSYSRLDKVSQQTSHITERASERASHLVDQIDSFLSQFSFERSQLNNEKK